MYCPSCGSNNEEEVKFCRRCGSNLGVVSDALEGRSVDQSRIDERMVKLFKDYYSGRNAMIIGSAAMFIALFKSVLFALIGLPPRMDFLGTLTTGLLIYGIIAVVSGLARWNNSTSEIKAIERAASRSGSLRQAEDRPVLPSAETGVRTNTFSTDPLGVPGSVTEQTTRQLDRGTFASAPEREQDRSR